MIAMRELPFEQRYLGEWLRGEPARAMLQRAALLERACVQAIAKGCGVRVMRETSEAEPVVTVDPSVPAGMIHEHRGWL